MVYFFYHSNGQKCIYLKDNICTIYQNRPYACRTYPFSYEPQTNNFQIDDNCPEFGKSEGLELIVDKKVNPKIIDNFINPDMIKYSSNIYGETDEYIKFCIKHQLIMPLKDSYSQEPFNSFQPDFYNNLYVAYQPKVTVAILKKKAIFAQNRFQDFLKAQINSMENIKKMLF